MRPGRRAVSDDLALVGLYLGAFLVLAWAAHGLGVAPGEAPRLRAAMDLAPVFHRGPPSLVERAQLGGGGATILPTFLSTYLWLLLARRQGGALIDPLLALRLGAIVISAATVPLVYALSRRRLGQGLALMAAGLCLLVPRAVEQGAVLGGDGVLVALSLGALYAHLSSVERPTVARALGSALLFGLALSVSWAALLLVPVAIGHYAFTHRDSTSRLIRRGLLPVAGSVVAWLALAPACVVLATPWLWQKTGERLRDALVAATSPLVGPGLWAGRAPPPEAIPRGHGLTMLLLSLPSTTAVLSLLGLWAVLLRRGNLRREPLISLCLLCPLVVLGWPLVAPPALLAFPGHFSLAVPFLAIMASLGVAYLARGLEPSFGPKAAPALALLSLLLPALSTLSSPSTLSAAFPALAGGARRAAASAKVPLSDGTPALALAPSIDASAEGAGEKRAAVYSPEVKAEEWEMLVRLGRLRTAMRVVARQEDADFLVLSGNTTPDPARGARALQAVEREGQKVLTLYRAGR